jgi:hypothetical protein
MYPTIKLAYRQIIDASAQSDFEKNVFNDTYSELLLQAKVYNRDGKFKTVAEMISVNPKANSLHYKVGFAIGLYVDELNKKIPEIKDSLGNAVSFDIFKTDIVHSDITNKTNHKIAITYITKPQMLVTSFGAYLVLADPDANNQGPQDKMETYTIALQAKLSIVNYSLKEELS